MSSHIALHRIHDNCSYSTHGQKATIGVLLAVLRITLAAGVRQSNYVQIYRGWNN